MKISGKIGLENALIVGMAFFMLVVSVTSVDAQITPVFNVILTNQNPYPAEPGKSVNIEVEVQNTGLGDANNVVVEISPTNPFTLMPGTEKAKTYTRISALSSVKISYDLRVEDNTISNQYELEFRIYYANNPSSYLSKKVLVNVKGDPDFITESIWTVPENIEPGGRVKIYAKLKNIGTGTATNVQSSINSTSGLLIPVLSGGSVYLGTVEPNNEVTAEIELSVDRTAEQKTYPATLTISYKNELGEIKQKSFSIGIPVTGIIKLEIISIAANFERNVLQVEVANKGTTDANSVEVRLLMNNHTVGIDYTSQIKATKKATFEFPLESEGNAKIVFSYASPDLRQFEIEKEITITYERNQNGNPTGTIIVIVVIVVVGYIVWRRFLKRKKKKVG
ncbi:MAG: hypothetical protein QW404_03480 [Candidatus Nanoarchaeia archaeon]